jgi:hypothetical protein
LLKSIVCNLQYIDRTTTYIAIFGEDSYVNWEGVASMQKRASIKKRGNALSGGSTVWCYLLQYVQGDHDLFLRQPASCKITFRPFYLVHDAIASCFSTMPKKDVLDISIQSFFIVNLIGIVPLDALGEHPQQDHKATSKASKPTDLHSDCF